MLNLQKSRTNHSEKLGNSKKINSTNNTERGKKRHFPQNYKKKYLYLKQEVPTGTNSI